MEIRPIELKTANAFIKKRHRHHKPVVGHRFSIGAFNNGLLVGVAVAGRPVARMAGHPLDVLEVTRLCTDGTKNACSILYAALARAGKALGYKRIQTHILDSEHGTSLLASGWSLSGTTTGAQWKHSDGKPRRQDQPTCDKTGWEKQLNDRPNSTPVDDPDSLQDGLW